MFSLIGNILKNWSFVIFLGKPLARLVKRQLQNELRCCATTRVYPQPSLAG